MVLFLALIIVALDQIIKAFIVYKIKPVGSVLVIPGLLNFTYVENRGAALGIMQNKQLILIFISLIICAFFIYAISKFNIKNKLFLASACLIIGGGISNLIDRIRLSYVIDYIQLSFFPPICNLADYCVCIGAGLLIIYIIFCEDKENLKKGDKTWKKD